MFFRPKPRNRIQIIKKLVKTLSEDIKSLEDEIKGLQFQVAQAENQINLNQMDIDFARGLQNQLFYIDKE